jgi:oligoendopeptidase F
MDGDASGMIDKPRTCAILLIGMSFCGAGASAEPVPNGLGQAGQWLGQPQAIDLVRYYPTRNAALAELGMLQQAAAELPGVAAPEGFKPYLEQADSLIQRARRLSAYFTILKARNIDDRAAASAADQTDATCEGIISKVHAAVAALPAGAFARLARQDAKLRRYQYLASQLAAKASHEPPTEAARILDATATPALATFWTLYQKTARLPVEARSIDPQASSSPDRAVREAAWRARWSIAGTKADANAAILLGIVNIEEEAAKLKTYPDAASAIYADRGLDRFLVDSMLAAVQKNLSLYQAYHRLRATRLAALGIADAQPWDTGLLQPGTTSRFKFDEVRKTTSAALAPLGTDYVRHFSALLTPSSGRLDIATEVGNREAGGFSVKAAGVPSGLYMASFAGALNDARIVVHEGGHAVAAQLADEGGTPSFFVEGPNWLTESYAILNELLLYDYLARTSSSRSDRIAYMDALVDDMMFQVFGSAEEATLEQSIYDGVAAGKVQAASDLNDITFGVMKGFEPWSDDLLRTSSTLWSTKRLMFQDPFYLVNYLYAGIVAIDLYRESKVHPDTFPARYEALLRRGFDAPPLDLLASLLGQHQSNAALTDTAFQVMQNELSELSTLTTAESDRRKP